MQKKALVVAMGAALVVQGAFAQKKPEPDSVVTLYGKVYPELVFVSSKGATAAGTPTCTICLPAAGENGIIDHNEIASNNSRFGIRGHEKLGADLKAIFQLETQFRVDQGGTSFARRNSFVGLAHKGWGAVKLGRMDTPFKQYGDDVSFLGVTSGSFRSVSTVFRHVGFGPQNNAARFHERRVNAVQYESPDLGPAEFKVQWSTNENKTATRDPRVLSAGGQIEFGNLAIMLGYEEHRDLFGLSLNVPSSMRNNSDQSVRSKDRAYSIALKYKLGAHQFEIDANKKKYKESAALPGRILSYENEAYMFSWNWRISPQWRAAAHYIHATEGECKRVAAECNTDGLEGRQVSAGVAYHFSPRTFLYFIGTWLRNGRSSTFNNSEGDVNPGEDIQQVAAGIHTAF